MPFQADTKEVVSPQLPDTATPSQTPDGLRMGYALSVAMLLAGWGVAGCLQLHSCAPGARS